jgi:hypothetical protein
MTTVKIEHEQYGVLLNESFSDAVQLKLFLKVIQASLEMKKELSMFNGVDLLVHIPHHILVNSIITTTKVNDNQLSKAYKAKLEMEKNTNA